MMKLALYQCQHPEAPVLLLDSAARALREGAPRDEGERLLNDLFQATCLRESWTEGAKRGLR